MKEYPLVLESWGDDRYAIVSRGHHDIEEFKKKCREEFQEWMYSLDSKHGACPCEHAWYKAIPNKKEYSRYYVPSSEKVRGAFPVTIWYE